MVQKDCLTTLYVIAGATATGKTKLAVNLAKRIDGEIISADSMQIYKSLDIGTAKVTRNEMEDIPHHLIDILNPDENFSVADFVSLSQKIIGDIQHRGKKVIVAGGTGLYLNSLLMKKSFGSALRDDNFRNDMLNLAKSKGSGTLLEKLKLIDPETAKKFHENDLPRIIRALEIFHLTGKKKSETVDEREFKFPFKAYFLDVPREILYERINGRVDDMMSCGLMEECENIFKKFPNAQSLQSMKAIGYKEFFPYFNGEASLDETANLIKQHSRNYAKRQFTWFRNSDFYKPLNTLKTIQEQIDEIIG